MSSRVALTLLSSMLFGAFVLWLFPVTAHAEVKDSSADGFTLENSEVVPVSAQRAWEAMVGGVDGWWPRDHTWWGSASTLSIDAKAGGCFCEIDGPRQAEHMRVVFVDPHRSLRMSGALGPLQGMGQHGVLEFRLAEVEGGTRITWWYRSGGYGPEDVGAFAAIVDRVQAQQLGALAAYLRQPRD